MASGRGQIALRVELLSLSNVAGNGPSSSTPSQAGMPLGPRCWQVAEHESGQGTPITSMAQSPAGGEDSGRAGPGRHLPVAAGRALPPPPGAAGTLSNARNSGCAPCHWQAGSGSLVRPVSGGPGVATALRGDGGTTAMYLSSLPTQVRPQKRA